MLSYCPKCGQLLNDSTDTERLCSTCGWFGDSEETLEEQTLWATIIKDVCDILDQYQSACQLEVRLSSLAELGQCTLDDLLRGRQQLKLLRQSVVELFIKTTNIIKLSDLEDNYD